MDHLVDSMASYAVGLTYDDLPEEVVVRAKHLIGGVRTGCSAQHSGGYRKVHGSGCALRFSRHSHVQWL